MRAIDADRFLAQIEDQYMEHDITREKYMDLEDRIMQQPTIEERKTGKWIELDSDEDRYDEIMCPHCRREFTVDAYHWTDIGFTKSDLKFCPNCGADMRGEEHGC